MRALFDKVCKCKSAMIMCVVVIIVICLMVKCHLPHVMGGMTGDGLGHGIHASMPSAGFHHHPYNMAQQQDWSRNKFASYRHAAHNDKQLLKKLDWPSC